ncbi:unnamed protein product [Rotaria magnacalcarata]|uniref:Uncharacterized protein n=1 Tax=Rotaria magnacalcarata TaxID=392030 RepID=A0A815EP10_9BILA|nr:unnamed protein product [Rotaria magnacalcarata]CAF1326852.1 unnamed protein product [Rotaria magnacalcarata]CAF2033133.1 unnamed protein product [Rotaria magnacalcarata]CAF2176950.1 unnamed protein product [Rotaria magnacalcarata]CAF3782231.1 unnamed protein product [Rotaria magnacalcarata]
MYGQKLSSYLIHNDDTCQIINFASFDNQTTTKYNFHFLPNIFAEIKNFAIWKYTLSKEHIQRLFISGLSYAADDCKQQKQNRLQANTFTFKRHQQYFPNEFLVPFNEPFNTTK